MTMPTFFVPLSVVQFVYLSNPNPYPNSALNVSVSIFFSAFFAFFVLCYCVFVVVPSLFIFILNASFVALCGLGLSGLLPAAFFNH